MTPAATKTTKTKAPKAPRAARAAKMDTTQGRDAAFVGEVISDKMQKTISVRVYRTVQHQKYGKYQQKSSVFKAHDEKSQAKMGDLVRIVETRPLSKTKRFRLTEIVQAKGASQAAAGKA